MEAPGDATWFTCCGIPMQHQPPLIWAAGCVPGKLEYFWGKSMASITVVPQRKPPKLPQQWNESLHSNVSKIGQKRR